MRKTKSEHLVALFVWQLFVFQFLGPGTSPLPQNFQKYIWLIRQLRRPYLEFQSVDKPTAEMPPKKKGNKKNQQDDWEAELGESIAPPAADTNGADGDANNDDDEGGAGGLMATLRKNKEKRKKKGIVEPEPAPEEPAAEEPPAPAPVEANIDDEFAMPEKKGKGGKQNKQPAKKPEPAAADDAEGGRILTKAEKEKLKKEREKQRKKEQVCFTMGASQHGSLVCIGC